MISEDKEIRLWRCPDCDLLMSAVRIVEHDDSSSTWECWRCGHHFGVILDGGSPDIEVRGA